MKWRKAINIGILIGGLLLIAGCEFLNFPLPFSGSWHGELLMQPDNDHAEPLTMGLDLVLTQTAPPGAITGHINIAMPTFYLSLNIKQGWAENGTVAITAAGTAGGLPDSPVFTFQFTGTKTALDKIEGTGTYSVGKASHDFTWWAKRGEQEGASGTIK